MTVYQVYAWDSYASRGGDYELHGTYASADTANAECARLNTQAEACWMAHASPGEGQANWKYQPKAHVKEVTVAE